jgi:4'-phosphopantetheinyl transferase
LVTGTTTLNWEWQRIDTQSQVHSWVFRADQGRAVMQRLAVVLTPDERQRGERFHFESDRISFSVTRACLRLLLAHFRTCSPADLRLTTNPFGKPQVEGGPLFNVSHSGAYSVIAIACDRNVGVDVEWMRPRPLDDRIDAYFSGAEASIINRLQGTERLRAFYSCWTRKEAYLKARGEGLSFGLDRFAVSIAPSEAALLWVRDEKEETKKWRLRDLSIGLEYAGALAAEGQDWELATWNLDVLRCAALIPSPDK